MIEIKPDSTVALAEREASLVRFLWEAEEVIAGMETALSSLLHDGANLELIEQLFYQTYRVREGALAAGLNEVSQLARVMENVFEHARRGQVEMTSDLVSLLVPGCEALRRLIVGVDEAAEEREVLGEGADGSEAPESNAVLPAVSSR